MTTNETSDTALGETQHKNNVKYPNVDTEFERVRCDYPKQLTRKRFTLDPTTILELVKLLSLGGR